MTNELKLLQEQLPFLTLFKYGNEEGVGIIQNSSKTCTSIYVLNSNMPLTLKKHFIELADEWWWSSNRKIPINLFFKKDFDIFKPYIVNYITRELIIVEGHKLSLQNLNSKRVKRKRNQLVMKL